jgi:tetratricopeptide (TPR) repeat protein
VRKRSWVGILLLASLGVAGAAALRAYAHDGNGAHNVNDEKIKKLTEALAEYPDDMKSLVVRGLLYVQSQQEYELGLADFEKALSLKPKTEETDEAKLKDWRNYEESARLGRAIARYRLGDWKGAVGDFDSLCGANTKTPGPWIFRGALRHELGLEAEARADLDHALEMLPEKNRQPFIFVARGDVLAALGKAEEALADYTTALGRDPRNLDALCGRGVLYSKLGKKDEMQRDLDAISELAPKDARLFAARARIALREGYGLQAKAYSEAALAAYRLEATACRSPNRRALLLLEAARLQAEAAGPWAGLEVLDEAIGLAPDRPDLMKLRVKLLEVAKPPAKPELLDAARKRLAAIEALRGVAPVGSPASH